MSFSTPLSGLDFAVIGAYFAVTLSAGLFMARFVKSGRDFFSGGNRVPWWMGAISSYMAMISLFVFIAHGGIACEVAVGAAYVEALGGAFETNKLLMGLVGVPIVIPSVFGILWKRPNTKGVVLCIVLGVTSGLVALKIPSLKWEFKTLVQIAVCFAGYFGGTLFGTSKREAESREGLFRELAC